MVFLGTEVFWFVTAAVICAFFLDLIFGDPSWLPHPVVWIGRMVDSLQKPIHKMFSASPLGQVMAGAYLVVIILFDTIALFGGICALGFYLHPLLGFFFEALWCAQSLALRGLMDAGKKVRDALLSATEAGKETEAGNVIEAGKRTEAGKETDAGMIPESETVSQDLPLQKKDMLEQARQAVSEIVGRDTDALDETGIIKATVETLAENASDGVCAPLFYMLIGGAPAAFIYKAINTMDSMIGYKNKKYFYFGKVAARLDDVANLIPARLTAVCMMLAAFLLPGYDGMAACRIWWRDRYTQSSPNATQTESVMAGALGIELLGDASYFGTVVHKPVIGDKRRSCEISDIDRANRLIFTASVIFFIIGITARISVMLFL